MRNLLGVFLIVLIPALAIGQDEEPASPPQEKQFFQTQADDAGGQPNGQDGGENNAPGNGDEEPTPYLPAPEGIKRLAKDYRIWADMKRKLVVVDGRICLSAGQLEMFACPKQTKEHESIVAVDCPAQFVHAGLLLIGAKPGAPVKFAPTYVAATGPKIEVLVLWKDSDGKGHKVRAQQWIRNTTTGKEMKHDWVFAGSGFWVDKETGKQHYYGDDGDFICVSNFSTATLDLPIKSLNLTDSLLFEVFPDRVPPRGTPVRMVLRVMDEKKSEPEKPQE